MPFTPYHFGPSGFIGLVFKRWIDLPVFVLANVAVDVEVLVIVFCGLGRPVHRYCHTLLIGALAGAAWGLLAYTLRPLFAYCMRLLRLSYQSSLRKMVLSGILGVWLHVLIDGADHWDVRAFWPNKQLSLWRMVPQHIGNTYIEDACVVFFLVTIIVYLILMARKEKHPEAPNTSDAGS